MGWAIRLHTVDDIIESPMVEPDNPFHNEWHPKILMKIKRFGDELVENKEVVKWTVTVKERNTNG